jgi:hypothetical protein
MAITELRPVIGRKWQRYDDMRKEAYHRGEREAQDD